MSGDAPPPCEYIKPHPELARKLKTSSKLRLCWVVVRLTRKEEREKRILAVMGHCLLLASMKQTLKEKAGHVIRVMHVQEIESIEAKPLNPPDTKDTTPCHYEIFVKTRGNEPGLLLRLRADRRNVPSSPTPQLLVDACRAAGAVDLSLNMRPSSQKLCDISQLTKNSEYEAPGDKLERWRAEIKEQRGGGAGGAVRPGASSAAPASVAPASAASHPPFLDTPSPQPTAVHEAPVQEVLPLSVPSTSDADTPPPVPDPHALPPYQSSFRRSSNRVITITVEVL